jgi:crotonobetainyl-CoA:carnitine CoA-transferase CaiB-like acyl-CoA transferase
MQILGSATSGATENRAAAAHGLDITSIITKVASIKEARALPPGAVIGDLHGGLTFTDAVAAALESRSHSGWREIQTATGQVWTIIVVEQ